MQCVVAINSQSDKRGVNGVNRMLGEYSVKTAGIKVLMLRVNTMNTGNGDDCE